MKQRPILFNAEMVRAILDGRKTQTRRVVSDRQLHLIDVASQVGECYPLESGIDHENSQSYYREHCPLGMVGDRLWVREAFQGPLVDMELMDDLARSPENYENPKFCEYRADGGKAPEYFDCDENLRHGWRPSIHMPRWASRITLEITNVRVEHLSSISEEDAKAEGVSGLICPCCNGDPDYSETVYDPETLGAIDEIPCRACDTNRSKFFTLWDSIYGEYSHCEDLWVWVVEFKRVDAS